MRYLNRDRLDLYARCVICVIFVLLIVSALRPKQEDAPEERVVSGTLFRAAIQVSPPEEKRASDAMTISGGVDRAIVLPAVGGGGGANRDHGHSWTVYRADTEEIVATDASPNGWKVSNVPDAPLSKEIAVTVQGPQRIKTGDYAVEVILFFAPVG